MATLPGDSSVRLLSRRKATSFPISALVSNRMLSPSCRTARNSGLRQHSSYSHLCSICKKCVHLSKDLMCVEVFLGKSNWRTAKPSSRIAEKNFQPVYTATKRMSNNNVSRFVMCRSKQFDVFHEITPSSPTRCPGFLGWKRPAHRSHRTGTGSRTPSALACSVRSRTSRPAPPRSPRMLFGMAPGNLQLAVAAIVQLSYDDENGQSSRKWQ